MLPRNRSFPERYPTTYSYCAGQSVSFGMYVSFIVNSHLKNVLVCTVVRLVTLFLCKYKLRNIIGKVRTYVRKKNTFPVRCIS